MALPPMTNSQLGVVLNELSSSCRKSITRMLDNTGRNITDGCTKEFRRTYESILRSTTTERETETETPLHHKSELATSGIEASPTSLFSGGGQNNITESEENIVEQLFVGFVIFAAVYLVMKGSWLILEDYRGLYEVSVSQYICDLPFRMYAILKKRCVACVTGKVGRGGKKRSSRQKNS